MAERRMFAKTIIDSDAFLDMPLSSQALYFHLSMRADDEGFLNNSKKIMRTIGANQNDYDLLILKRFIIQFPDGICVIKHWRMHNWIRGDRKKDTIYQKEMEMLDIKKNGSYTLADTCQTDGSQVVDTSHTQVRLGKVRLGKVSKDIVQPDCTEKVSKADIDDFFEKIWKLYPNKKGKGQVKDTQKKKLHKVGYKDLEKCIERYKTELKKEDWRKPQNGSTFFNSGYVDYLDGNYEPSKVSKPNKNSFNNLGTRERTQTETDELEKKLLGLN